MHPRHRVLLDGSTYRGRSVMDTSAKRATRAQKSRASRAEAPSEEKATEEKAK